MRPVLRLLGTRYGVALVLALLVLGIVGITRAVAGSYQATTFGPAVEPSFSSSIDPTAGDDSVLTPDSPAPPSTSPGAPEPAKVAIDFVQAWLNHTGVTAEQWRAGFAKYATSALRDKLKDTDPAGVPAQRVTGSVVLENRAAQFVEASLPLDSGTVHLRLLSTNGRWLVDGVDWERT
ncbi:hypothetical protein HC028_04345 [Planosporangium flavigriseum]|uniref:Uncharacterized protein n=1 Tax=Planosporangium flavigriseum TaxID=373681 RepID=A0A8J3LTV9_9ACTN|nr:hypothetical protein [Planosporangium flavigriseum]NJC63740.1 hypothetical protein [Planosporangium flavigriseum]GIG73764.1 hypothetical protein Pfl04_21680 [Planosporangium flavigriseum]